MSGRRKKQGHVSFDRAALRDLNHSYGLTVSERYCFLMLVAYVDHKTGACVFVVDAFAEYNALNYQSVKRWMRTLERRGLVLWVRATNQEIPGQAILPGYDWFTAVQGSEPPPNDGRRIHAGHPPDTGRVAGDPTTPSLPAETGPKKSRSQEVQERGLSGAINRASAPNETDIQDQPQPQKRDEDNGDEEHQMRAALSAISPTRWLVLEALVALGRPAWISEVQDVVADFALQVGLKPRRHVTVFGALEDLVNVDGLAVRVRREMYDAKTPHAEKALQAAFRLGLWPDPDYLLLETEFTPDTGEFVQHYVPDDWERFT